MNLRQASPHSPHTSRSTRPSPQIRSSSSFGPSLRRRRTSASIAEEGHDQAAEHVLREEIAEIAEIKRYEDFTTIDWVQDAAREQLRRKARRKERAGFLDSTTHPGWRRKVWESYDAAQAWVVVTLVGAAIGLNAAVLNIVTEWLGDIKLGHCSTGFYLNENFCCWGAENGGIFISNVVGYRKKLMNST